MGRVLHNRMLRIEPIDELQTGNRLKINRIVCDKCQVVNKGGHGDHGDHGGQGIHKSRSGRLCLRCSRFKPRKSSRFSESCSQLPKIASSLCFRCSVLMGVRFTTSSISEPSGMGKGCSSSIDLPWTMPRNTSVALDILNSFLRRLQRGLSITCGSMAELTSSGL